MLNKSISDKNNIVYQASIDDKTFKKENDGKVISWSIAYSVTDEKKEQIGFGHFVILCDADHEHLSSHDNMIQALLENGSRKIREDINNGEPIESKRYRMRVANCLE